MQCQQRSLHSQDKFMCKRTSAPQKLTKHNELAARRNVSNLHFREIEVRRSIIDKLIPCLAALGPSYQLHLDALTPSTTATNLLNPVGRPFKIQKRLFRARSGQAGVNMPDYDQDKHIENIVKKMTKSLKMDSKEAMSFSLGIKEGLNMKPAGSSEKSNSKFLKRSFNIALGIALLWFLWQGFNRITDQAGRDSIFGRISNDDYKAEIPDVSFEDVKGMEEVKKELQNVVEFLKDPDRFTNLGGKLPKGILLAGPPGTGKTLLARAIAGEANVPFYFASGSEFDEVFVGVGSARIRKLFNSARETAPCIIFIDEIDACGSARLSSPLHPHARQTINQLLQEMDGFSAHEGVIVLAATNMAQVLDKALTRPGRFDTEIKILPPDINGRKEILDLYASRIVHGGDLDMDKIARLTGGMTGAALSNLVNQAALRAAQQQKSYADMSDFEYALDKMRLGPELKTRLRTEKELENTAFHEAGHALVAHYTAETMPIYKATIIQRGGALGHVSMIPTHEDETSTTRAKLLAQIDVAMGGRVAEELLKGKEHVTTGASSDLESATTIAQELVCKYGMSDNLGLMRYSYDDASPDTKMRIEKEVNLILENSYAKAKDLLIKHSYQHKLLTKGLLKYETLSLEEIKVLLATQNIKSVEKLRNQQTKKRSSEQLDVVSVMEGVPSTVVRDSS